jgi:hypothetical protein
MKKAASAQSLCPSCRHRRWRTISGFTVLGCPIRKLRFGIQPDIAAGRVNKDGGCVAMPERCAQHEA